MHEDETPLEAVVHFVIAGVSDTSPLDLLPPHLSVVYNVHEGHKKDTTEFKYIKKSTYGTCSEKTTT
jgi:hypothetical protein